MPLFAQDFRMRHIFWWPLKYAQYQVAVPGCVLSHWSKVWTVHFLLGLFPLFQFACVCVHIVPLGVVNWLNCLKWSISTALVVKWCRQWWMTWRICARQAAIDKVPAGCLTYLCPKVNPDGHSADTLNVGPTKYHIKWFTILFLLYDITLQLHLKNICVYATCAI